MLRQRQLILFGKVLRAPNGSLMKAVSFIGNTLRPETDHFIRRVGRPRTEWVPKLLAEARNLVGGSQHLEQKAADPKLWKQIVKQNFK